MKYHPTNVISQRPSLLSDWWVQFVKCKPALLLLLWVWEKLCKSLIKRVFYWLSETQTQQPCSKQKKLWIFHNWLNSQIQQKLLCYYRQEWNTGIVLAVLPTLCILWYNWKFWLLNFSKLNLQKKSILTLRTILTQERLYFAHNMKMSKLQLETLYFN